jgi:poly(3-hydroxybutyrate) depolymerase
MFKTCIKLLLFFLLISCKKTESDSIAKNISSTEIFITQKINGYNFTRSVLIQTPPEIDSSKIYPIVFAYHGNGGRNSIWINILKKFTDNGEFIGIYPQGHKNSWNLGSESSTADDVEFTNLIINELKNYSNIDFEKIYAIGNSNGSGLVNKLAIETNHFKAIAPIVSQLMISMPIKKDTQPVSIFQVNGVKDNIIPINGGNGPGTHIFLDALKSAQTWSTFFNCSKSDQKFVGKNFSESGINRLYSFSSCDNQKEILYLRVENGAHNVLRSYSNLVNEIWSFFKKN